MVGVVAAVMVAAAPTPLPAAEKKKAVRPPMQVRIDAVIRQPRKQTVPVIGRFVALQAGVVAARINGPVGEVRVEVGDRVKAGDVIAVLVDDADLLCPEDKGLASDLFAAGNAVYTMLLAWVKQDNIALWTAAQGTRAAITETIADTAEGTPWPDSVVVVGTAVLWASRQGIRVLIASPEADIEGRRARISPIGEQRFRSWFEDAFNNNEVIDAGVDEINGCVRFRRAIITPLGTHYQVLQYNYRNDSFVFLDDDSGFIYANTVDVSGTGDSQRLYSVTKTGNV
ncbi:MAG: biotin/lipoyl-binding protein, partial [Proteobacteria bacterium]|nr:biotin/lipoyl-binding protein [Pseudomonadota bacterium]